MIKLSRPSFIETQRSLSFMKRSLNMNINAQFTIVRRKGIKLTHTSDNCLYFFKFNGKPFISDQVTQIIEITRE